MLVVLPSTQGYPLNDHRCMAPGLRALVFVLLAAPASAATLSVPAGGDLQAALDKVALGLLDDHARHCIIGGASESQPEELKDDLKSTVADLANVSGGARLYVSDHGSMSPWTIRNTCFAWGVDFKRGATVRTPVSNVDITPTHFWDHVRASVNPQLFEVSGNRISPRFRVGVGL